MTMSSTDALRIRSIRYRNQPIRAAHVFLEQAEKRLGNGPWPAVANLLSIPLDDRSDFHRTAEEQHLTATMRFGLGDVANFDTLEESLFA